MISPCALNPLQNVPPDGSHVTRLVLDVVFNLYLVNNDGSMSLWKNALFLMNCISCNYPIVVDDMSRLWL